MRIECVDYNPEECSDRCYMETTENDLTWLRSVGAFERDYCSKAEKSVKWRPTGFIGWMMEANGM